jgi:hypothetical protein
MKPIGWTKRSVQLECDSCGAHTRLELLPYLSAVRHGIPLQCWGCGEQEIPGDRRRAEAAPTAERRVMVRA